MSSTDSEVGADGAVRVRHGRDMRDLATSLLDLVLGRSCAGCDEPGVLLCDQCILGLQPRVRLRRDLDVSDVMEGLRIPVVCALDYRGATRQVLFRYKDHRIRQLAGALSPALAASITFAAEHAAVPLREILISPVPTRRSSIRRRGFDATVHLADGAAKLTRSAGVAHVLADVRSEGAVKHSGAFERELRAADAFRVQRHRDLPHRPVILVDDIVTTGATVKEAVETLILAGVHVVAVATVAGTP